MPQSPASTKTGKSAVWILRISWISLAFVGPIAGAGALRGRLDGVRWTATFGLWAVWFVVLVALLVPSVTTLTVIRLSVPAAPVIALTSLVAGAETVPGVIALIVGAIATVVALSGDVGQSFVQASAYGDETRFPLRPPGPLLLGPMQLLWAISIGPLSVGPIMIGAGHRLWGVAISIFGLLAIWTLASRFHQLSRRWLVLVPAGLVIHDNMPLAETVMVASADIDALNLAPADTRAVDLTANALGSAVEVGLRRATGVAIRGASRSAASEAVTATSLLISPTRPGRVVAAARQRGW